MATAPARATAPNPLDVGAAQLVARERGKRRRATWTVAGARLAILVVGLALWQWVAGPLFGKLNVSSPALIAQQGWNWTKSGYLGSNLLVTLEEAALGFAAGTVAGIIVGILLGSSVKTARILGPFVSGFYAVPKVVLAPLLVVWLGIGMPLKVGMAFLFVFFLVVYTTWSGLVNVSKELTDALKLMGASRLNVVRTVVLPAVFAWVLTGLRVSFPLALIGALLGELLASSDGIGYVVRTAGDAFDVTGIFVGVIALTIVAILVDSLIAYFEGVAKAHGLVGNI